MIIYLKYELIYIIIKLFHKNNYQNILKLDFTYILTIDNEEDIN